MLKSLIALVLLLTAAHAASQLSANFEIYEETELNTTVGSLRDAVPPYLLTNAAFHYQGHFFSVDSQSGDIKVITRIDRESLCQEHKQCCGIVSCTLTPVVYVVEAMTGNYLAVVHLNIQVNDVNDNKPAFASPVQRVSIPENSEVGKLIGLRPATDADVDPRNQITRYQWSEPTRTLVLDQTNLPSTRLRLNASIDRERRSNYTGVLRACDSSYCVSTDVIIEIEDVNDNPPLFHKSRHHLETSESLAVGSVILQLNATDADSPENARIFYSFGETVDSDLVDTFEIGSNTGEIILRRPLDAKIRSFYRFKVIACDTVAIECAGNPSSNLDVEITVKDVNNNRPIIEIVPGGELTSSYDDLAIPENYPPGQIAVVRIKDADIGENARTACDLDSPTVFELSHSAPDLYSLRTLQSFDFEQESVHITTIRCHDFGSPPLSSTRTLNLRILDVNEYPPQFSMLVFSASILENSPPGLEIINLSAVDRDGQSELRYSLVAPPLQHSPNDDVYVVEKLPNSAETFSVNAHFDLDPKTGVLRTGQVQLDREVIERITLIVTVTDALVQQIFTATATVSIQVLDENDNSPVFVNPPASMNLPFHQNDAPLSSFTVKENSPRYTRLSGRLEARDPDAGQNGNLQFSLRSVWALKSLGASQGHRSEIASGNIFDDVGGASPGRQLVEQRAFQITPDGSIETLVEFDRELVATYLLNVAVRDNGSQPLATSTSLLVHILDENDNAPVWTFPSDLSRQINITTANPPGSLVARLQAFDLDADESSKVDFQVLDRNGQPTPPVTISRGLYNAPVQSSATLIEEEVMGYRTGPFYLNGSTGEILVADRLVPLSLKIRLRAVNPGHYQSLFTDTWMLINVKMDPNDFGGFLGSGRTGALNVTIILVMIAITAVISLLLIVAIVCVRRKPSRAVVSNGTTDGRVIAYSPGSPFLVPDPCKKVIATNAWMGSTKDFYSTPPGCLTIDESGQVVSTGVIPYGSPLLGSDKTNAFCSSQPQSLVHAPLELNGDIVSGTLPMQTFGTISRNLRQAGVVGSIHGSTTGIRMVGSLQHDADSGDSGRGPSEDGNQLMMLENQRMFSPHPGYLYGTGSAYRSSNQMNYGPRSASAMSVRTNSGIDGGGNGMMNACSRTYIHDPHNNDDNCSCYVEQQPHQHQHSHQHPHQQHQQHLLQSASATVDTGIPFAVQSSPLGGYRTFHFPPSPQQCYHLGAGETQISASVNSLPRSRDPSRSTATFQSSNLQLHQQSQQPIKLDLRGSAKTNSTEANFSSLPPRSALRTATNRGAND